MKMISFIMAVLCLNLSFVRAQNSGEISGKVREQKNGRVLPYASLTVMRNDSILAGTISDDKGGFRFTDLTLGTLSLEVSFVGFLPQTRVLTLTESSPNIILPDILLEEDVNALKEVVVEGELTTIEQRIDRKVINVGKDLTSLGGSTMDLLDNIPSLEVDPQGTISLRGNNNLQLFVDGRATNQSPATLLRQIPPSSISKVEVITNPSAKYSPEGSSGIINIILKKNLVDGYTVSINTGYTIGLQPKYNGSINSGLRMGKWGFSLLNSISKSIYPSQRSFDRFTDDSRHFTDFQIDMTPIYNQLSVDFFLSKNHQLSGLVGLSTWKGKVSNNIDILFNDDREDIISRIDGTGSSSGAEYNLFYQGFFNEKKNNLKVEANYEEGSADDLDAYTVFGFEEKTFETNKSLTFNLDYANASKDQWKWEMGAAVDLREQTKDFVSTQTGSPVLDHRYDRDVFSIYGQGHTSLGPWELQLGLRGEVVQEVGRSFNERVYENDYTRIYPSLYIHRSLKEGRWFFQYSNRIDRPAFNLVNPVRFYNTPSFISIGNINLQPQLTNGFELGYSSRKKTRITTSVFYRRIKNEIIRTLEISPTDPNVTLLSYDNLSKTDVFGAELGWNRYLFEKFRIIANLDYNYRTLVGSVVLPDTSEPQFIETQANSVNGRIILQYRPKKELTFQASQLYRNSRNFLQGRYEARSKFDVAAIYSVLKGKGRISLNFKDIFNNWDVFYTTQVPFDQKGINDIESQTFFVGFNYAFGGKVNSIERSRRDDFNINQRDKKSGIE